MLTREQREALNQTLGVLRMAAAGFETDVSAILIEEVHRLERMLADDIFISRTMDQLMIQQELIQNQEENNHE